MFFTASTHRPELTTMLSTAISPENASPRIPMNANCRRRQHMKLVAWLVSQIDPFSNSGPMGLNTTFSFRVKFYFKI